MKKTIGIVVCALPPRGGGIGNNAYYQARALARLGYRVTILTPAYSGAEKISAPDFAVEYLPVSLSWGKAGLMLSLFKNWRRFDLLHFYYPFFGTDFIVLMAKFLWPRQKLILHYEMDPIGDSPIKKFLFWLHLFLFLRPLIRASDRVGILSFDHADNSHLKKHLIRWPQKFVELPNGIDAEIFQPSTRDEALARDLGLEPGDRCLIFVGGLDRQHYFKGLEILLSALRKTINQTGNQHLKLLVVGDGDRRPYYENLAQKLDLNEQVIFVGWIKNENLPAYYALAEIFVLPSTAGIESFGIVVAEAQACGLPVIVSDWPGVRVTLKPEETGCLVRPKDVEDLTQKISLLLGDENLRQRWGRAGSERARQRYSWESLAQVLDQLYQSL